LGQAPESPNQTGDKRNIWGSPHAEEVVMLPLAQLDHEFNDQLSRFELADRDDELAAAIARRLGDLMGEIAATPPASVADCVVKLRRLADPELGIDAGDRDDDVSSLRQVIGFLAAACRSSV
jgi:hypothetical protein